MDMSCDYINNEWYCESPKIEGKEFECICSNYKLCMFFPQSELRTKLPYERENDLEREAKK
jgi:hypothetical protein